MDHWFVLLPPLLAIVIAIWKKEIVLALLLGLWLSETLLVGLNPFLGMLGVFERIISVFTDPDNTRILLFSLLIGALLALFRVSGGVDAFVQRLSVGGWIDSPRRVALLPCFIGLFVFIESMLSILTSAIISRRLFDKFNFSRAKLAYLVDSTCSPVSILLLLNAWGAFILAQIQDYPLGNPVKTLVYSIGFNFYPWLAIIVAFYTAITGRLYGPLRHATSRVESHIEIEQNQQGKVQYMVIPIIVLSASMLAFMFYTGSGDLFSGSGSQSAWWAVSLATLICALLLLKDKIFNVKKITQVCFTGMGELLPLVTVLLLALTLGASFIELGTGKCISNLVGDFLPAFLIAPILFIVAAFVSFTTGTSWGTFALVIPIGMPLVIDLNIPSSFALAAILGGGVWGDHCSPISDSTLLSSIASGCDHLEHVATQLPYALTLGGVSIALYTLGGMWISL